MTPLLTLDTALALLRARPALTPVRRPLDEAVGCVLAEAVGVAAPAPLIAQALRAGFAVEALQTVGASVQAPVMLAETLRAVRPGDPLPPGTDAVVKPHAVKARGPFTEVEDAVAPGEGARLSGHDAAPGSVLLDRGERLSAARAVALAAAGITAVSVRVPRVRVEATATGLAPLLSALIAAFGGHVTDGEADLVLRRAALDTPGLALSPGDTAALAVEGAQVVIGLPIRFDGAVAAALALVCPALAHLTGHHPALTARPLARKIVSAVGLTEVALLRAVGDSWEPLSVGEITATGLARADAFALIPPGLEGLAAGDSLAAVPLVHPLP